MGGRGEVDAVTAREIMASVDDAAEVERMIDWLFDHAADTLSTWEGDFLRRIEGLAVLSARERAKLDEIYTKRGGR